MRPSLRIIHHLHRTGGTLISKCLASLPNIALLSEVNPGAAAMVLDPVFQASFWLRLLSDHEAEQLRDATFVEKTKAVHLLATARGERLVLRNWAYLDFFAVPFAPRATNQLSTVDALEDEFELKQVVTVRHPMDQWLSWCRYRGAAKASDFTFQTFVEACLEFANRTQGLPIVRYEDFVKDPQLVMQRLCRHLELEYDPVFMRRWPYYHQITGDDNDRASGDWSIGPRERHIPDRRLKQLAADSTAYRALLQYYEYS